MLLAILVSALIVIISLLYVYAQRQFSFWKRRGVPCLETSFPMGNLQNVGKTVHFAHRIQEIYETFKKKHPVAGFYFLTSPRLVITNLDFLKYVLIKDFNSFRNRGVYYNEENDPLSGHLFNMENDKWKSLRTKLSPTFTSGKMKTMYPIIGSKTQELLKLVGNYADEKKVLDIKDVCVRYTADVVASCAFGLECNCLTSPNDEFMVEARRVFNFKSKKRQLEFFFQNTFKSIAAKFNSRTVLRETEDYFMRIISNATEFREKNPAAYNDFFNILLNIHKHGVIKGETDEEVGKISFNEMAAQAFVFFFAGFETTSTTLYFAIFELARNQDIQCRAREEARNISAKYDNKLDYEACMELNFIGQTVNESLRMYNPVHTLFREAAEDYKIPETDIVIPKNTSVLIPVHAIHRDPEVYPEPDVFDPERFSPENVKSRHPYSFLPFGDGPRNCIGMRFALLEARLALAELLLNFKFTMNEKTDSFPVLDPKDLLMSVKNGVWLNVERI